MRAHSCLYGCCRPASGYTVRGVSKRGRVINQGSHQTQNSASIKEVWVLVLGFFTLFQLLPPGSLVLNPRNRMGVLGENVGRAGEEFEDECGILA